MIKKVGNKWVVSDANNKYLGTYDSKYDADKRIKQNEETKQKEKHKQKV